MKPNTCYAHVASVALLLSILCISAAHAQRPELQFVQLNEDMYVFFSGPYGPGNATALITDEGVVLIDAKIRPDYERMVELLGTVTDQPVKYIVSTHFHGDHTGTNALFQETGADVIATEQAWRTMVELDQAGRPVFTIEDSGRVHLGGKVIELLHTGRGHTGGDLVAYLPEYRVLVAGDLFIASGDQLIDYAGGGSVREWTRTLDKILMLDFDTAVPGHGGAMTDKAAVRAYRDRSVVLRERVQEMIAAENSRDEIEAVLRSDFGWQDIHVRRGLDGIITELTYQ